MLYGKRNDSAIKWSFASAPHHTTNSFNNSLLFIGDDTMTWTHFLAQKIKKIYEKLSNSSWYCSFIIFKNLSEWNIFGWHFCISFYLNRFKYSCFLALYVSRNSNHKYNDCNDVTKQNENTKTNDVV